MARIDELRAEVKRRQQAVARKVRRIQNNGVDISGTEFDPRRSEAPIDKMRSRDLNTYLKQLNNFTSRRTQFVGDTRNRPIPRNVWQKYQAAERRANRLAAREFDKIKDIFIPTAGQTIGEREASTRSNFPRTANPATNSPFRRIERLPENIADRRALEKLTKQQQRKVDPRFMETFVRDGRKQLAEMLRVSNRQDIQREVDKLSMKQFHILWGWTNFSQDISQYYEINKGSNNSNRADEQVQDDALEEVGIMIDWISKIK